MIRRAPTAFRSITTVKIPSLHLFSAPWCADTPPAGSAARSRPRPTRWAECRAPCAATRPHGAGSARPRPPRGPRARRSAGLFASGRNPNQTSCCLGKSIKTFQKVTVIPSPDHLKCPLGPGNVQGFVWGPLSPLQLAAHCDCSRPR